MFIYNIILRISSKVEVYEVSDSRSDIRKYNNYERLLRNFH